METQVTIEDVKREVSVLTADQQQLLKDAINYGSWGNADCTFLKAPNAIGSENRETSIMWGYYTNAAKEGGHFEGRRISGMFRAIYRKMCADCNHQVGYIISHCRDWWGDGSGDMLFIRDGWDTAFSEWARQ